MGGILGGAWGSASLCRRGSCIVERVRLGGGLGGGVGAPAATKISASCQMVSMVWAPKRAKGASIAVLERETARRLAASVSASAEDIAGMVPLLEETVLFWRCVFPSSPVW